MKQIRNLPYVRTKDPRLHEALSDVQEALREIAEFQAKQSQAQQAAATTGAASSSKSTAAPASTSGSGGGGASGTGDVVGPAGATDGHLAVFDGATGKLLKDGGAVPSGSGGGIGLSYTIPISDSIPDFSTFTLVNSLELTAQTGGAGHPALFRISKNAGLNWRLAVRNIPSQPFSLIVRIPSLQDFKNSGSDVGLYFYDGTKLMGIERLYLVYSDPSTSIRPSTRVEKITDVTHDNSTAAQISGPTEGAYYCISQDASKLYFRVSLDGINWITVFSENTGTFITPTKVGVGGVSIGTASDAYFSVIYWRLLSTATP